MPQWYINSYVGHRYGPIERELVDQWVNEGRLTPRCQVWREGWPEWRNAPEIFPQILEVLARHEAEQATRQQAQHHPPPQHPPFQHPYPQGVVPQLPYPQQPYPQHPYPQQPLPQQQIPTGPLPQGPSAQPPHQQASSPQPGHPEQQLGAQPPTEPSPQPAPTGDSPSTSGTSPQPQPVAPHAQQQPASTSGEQPERDSAANETPAQEPAAPAMAPVVAVNPAGHTPQMFSAAGPNDGTLPQPGSPSPAAMQRLVQSQQIVPQGYVAPNPGGRPSLGNTKDYALSDRGFMILSLGLLSLAFGLICGVPAWSMGGHDLREIAAGGRDPAGRKMTAAGMTLGIVGTSVSLILGVVFLVWLILI